MSQLENLKAKRAKTRRKIGKFNRRLKRLDAQIAELLGTHEDLEGTAPLGKKYMNNEVQE